MYDGKQSVCGDFLEEVLRTGTHKIFAVSFLPYLTENGCKTQEKVQRFPSGILLPKKHYIWPFWARLQTPARVSWFPFPRNANASEKLFLCVFQRVDARGKQRISRRRNFKRLQKTSTAETSNFRQSAKNFIRLQKTS